MLTWKQIFVTVPQRNAFRCMKWMHVKPRSRLEVWDAANVQQWPVYERMKSPVMKMSRS